MFLLWIVFLMGFMIGVGFSVVILITAVNYFFIILCIIVDYLLLIKLLKCSVRTAPRRYLLIGLLLIAYHLCRFICVP